MMRSGPSATVPATELEALLEGRPLTAVRWGLGRMREMLARLDHPERSFASVHVGGTNGKGSTAAMIESVLRRDGRRTGLYTSPELLTFRDRIRIAGLPIPFDELEAPARRLRPIAREVDATYFEAVTALAFLAFERAGVEVAVVEVGLGGRLDATNALRPEVSVITSVARDHTRFLGESLEAITREKAGILKPGVPVALGPASPLVASIVESAAETSGAPLARIGREAVVEDVRVDLEGTRFTYRSASHPDGLRLRLPLPGAHQAANAGTALLALERMERAPDLASVREGLEGLRWPGRLQVMRRPDGLWILDAAHNPAAVSALTRTLDALPLPRPEVHLLAILDDKPRSAMFRALRPRGARTVLTVAPSSPASRRWDPEEVARELRDGGPEGVPRGRRSAPEVLPDFARAMTRARELAAGGTVVVAGSCYTAGDALRWLESGTGGPSTDAIEPISNLHEDTR